MVRGQCQLGNRNACSDWHSQTGGRPETRLATPYECSAHQLLSIKQSRGTQQLAENRPNVVALYVLNEYTQETSKSACSLSVVYQHSPQPTSRARTQAGENESKLKIAQPSYHNRLDSLHAALLCTLAGSSYYGTPQASSDAAGTDGVRSRSLRPDEQLTNSIGCRMESTPRQSGSD